MNLADTLFLLFSGAVASAGLMLGFSRSLVHAGFLLFAILFLLAGMYAILDAPFLAVTQVIVYVGGILILLLFGVMLTQKSRDLSPTTGWHNLIPGILTALGLFTLILMLILEVENPLSFGDVPPKPEYGQDSVSMLGDKMLTSWLLPFEMITVLLLAALVGAVWMVRPRHDQTQEPQ